MGLPLCVAQHSAPSTQHPALSTQHYFSARWLFPSLFVPRIVIAPTLRNDAPECETLLSLRPFARVATMKLVIHPAVEPQRWEALRAAAPEAEWVNADSP